MRSRTLWLPALAFAVAGSALHASTIKELKLADGREAENTIGSPVFDATTVGALRIGPIEAAYDRKAKIVRKTGGMMTKGPEYDLDPALNLADLLGEALRAEAPAMGFKTTQGDDFGWDVKGTLKEIYLESRQVPYGATQFWGYMLVEFQVKKAGGEAQTTTLRAHKYYASLSAGMGRQDEAREGLLRLLVEGAQEMVARLNQAHFGAPPHPTMVKNAASLAADKRNEIHLVGLSGTKAAVPVITRLIPGTTGEGDRSALIAALGRIGSPEVVSFLSGRFAKEDEDCRWASLKAMDYIGGAEAKALLELGTKDKDEACRRLASRILGGGGGKN